MSDAGSILGRIRGGRVLDVATGRGGFVQTLIDGLASYDEIVGIDISDRGAVAFAASFAGRPNVRFEPMDALAPTFPSGSFDSVIISDSLHHFEDPRAVLRPMDRLLRPGGTLIVSEMYRDHQTPTQRTHVLFHHWVASVDNLGGIVHRRTYRRADLLELSQTLELTDIKVADVRETTDDPRNPDSLAQLDAAIDRYLASTAGHPSLRARGRRIRRRLHAIGIHGATTLMIAATKPGLRATGPPSGQTEAPANQS